MRFPPFLLLNTLLLPIIGMFDFDRNIHVTTCLAIAEIGLFIPAAGRCKTYWQKPLHLNQLPAYDFVSLPLNL